MHPMQIVIKFVHTTFLLFNSGKCRFMGKSDLNTVSIILDNIVKCLDTSISIPLTISTQTVSFQLDVVHLNLHNIAKCIPNCMFEAELFPALTIDLWKPLHVNVFASGKVIILGKDSVHMKPVIEEWLLSKLK